MIISKVGDGLTLNSIWQDCVLLFDYRVIAINFDSSFTIIGSWNTVIDLFTSKLTLKVIQATD